MFEGILVKLARNCTVFQIPDLRWFISFCMYDNWHSMLTTKVFWGTVALFFNYFAFPPWIGSRCIQQTWAFLVNLASAINDSFRMHAGTSGSCIQDMHPFNIVLILTRERKHSDCCDKSSRDPSVLLKLHLTVWLLKPEKINRLTTEHIRIWWWSSPVCLGFIFTADYFPPGILKW